MNTALDTFSDEALSQLAFEAQETERCLKAPPPDLFERVRKFVLLYNDLAAKPLGAGLLYQSGRAEEGKFQPLDRKLVVGRLSKSAHHPPGHSPRRVQADGAFSLGENFVVTNSLTKTYGLSSLRCGWILAAPELARRIWLLNDFFAATPAHPTERLALVAFDHLAQFRERVRQLLERNRPLLDAFLDSRDDLECFRPAAGTIVFPRLTKADPATLFPRLRAKYETSVVPGEFFEMPRHFRLGIGGDTETLRGGLERLGAALDDFA